MSPENSTIPPPPYENTPPQVVSPLDRQDKTSPFTSPSEYISDYPASEDNIESSDQAYARGRGKLIAYLVPLPKPRLHDVPSGSIPDRFLIYTPPTPPFVDKPAEGQKESRFQKVNRKWHEGVREARTGDPNPISLQASKAKAIRGISWAAGQTRHSSMDFLNRVHGVQSGTYEPNDESETKGRDDGTSRVPLEEMLLLYPSSMATSQEQIREEFVNSMFRSKDKVQRQAIIATGLLPVTVTADLLMVTHTGQLMGFSVKNFIMARSRTRMIKTSRDITTRFSSDTRDGDKVYLNFQSSARVDELERYLAARCHEKDAALFPDVAVGPAESEVLKAIGWSPSSQGSADRDKQDERWEVAEAKEDLKSVMSKAAREWNKWCKSYAKDPEKAMKKA